MTLTLPSLRGHGRHRAADEVARLRQQLAEAAVRNADLTRRLAESETARDRANAKASQYEDQLLALAEVTRELRAARAALANATAVSAPAGVRDITPGDEPTQPIDVRPLWAAPFATTDPGRLPD